MSVRVGIVGCGDAALTVGLASRFVRRCRVSAVSDLNRDRMLLFARRFHAQPVDDWSDLLSSGLIDAVYLAVPHDLHRPLALAFAERGIAVLLEKPVAATLADAEELVATIPSGAKLAVNYQYRYDPRAHALIDACRAGDAGELMYAEVVVPWYRDESYFAGAGWHARKDRAGGGTLLTQGSHALDVALCACGEPAKATGRTYSRLHPSVEVEDLALGVVETDSGVPIVVSSSMVSRPASRTSITVYGTHGSVRYLGPQRPDVRARGFTVRRPVVWTQLHSYVGSLGGFVRWVEGGPPHRCTLADALPVMRAVDGLYRSAESDRTADVPPHARSR